MMYKNLMLDVETLSLQPNAAILQLAAVPFHSITEFSDPSMRHPSLDYRQPDELFDERIWPGSYSTDSQLNFDVSKETLAFWDVQDKATRAVTFSGMTDTAIVAQRFLSWLTEMQLAGVLAPYDSLRIWARNNQFDFPVIKNWLEECGQQWPFHHRMPREYYNEIEGVDKGLYSHITNHTWHNAVCDCLHQIRVLQFCQNHKANSYANNLIPHSNN